MEDKTYGTLVTDCGIQLIAAAVMEGKKINITDLAVGDGGGSYYKPNSTMTALKGEKWRGKVNRVEINEKQKPLSRFAIPLTRKKSSFQAERRAKSN